MTTLKNSDRDEVVRHILTETFTPRFSALQKQVRELAQPIFPSLQNISRGLL